MKIIQYQSHIHTRYSKREHTFSKTSKSLATGVCGSAINHGGGEVLLATSVKLRPGNVRNHGSGLFRGMSTSLGSEADL